MIIPPLAQAARTSLQHKQRSAPLKGLDLVSQPRGQRDGYALRLDNWVCRSDGLHVRDGWTFALGTAGWTDPVLSLIAHKDRVFAATATEIRDQSTVHLSGLSGGDWQFVQMVNSAGVWTAAVNGIDGMATTDGIDWHLRPIEGGPAPPDRIHWHHNRLFFAEPVGLDLWYLDIDAVDGAPLPIPMTQIFRRGGRIWAMATLTSDGGRGPDDQLAVVTSEGELAIWSGNDPDNATSWSLVGVYEMGKPLGVRCFAQYGGQLLYLSRDGLDVVPSRLGKPKPEKPQAMLTHRIRPLLEKSMAERPDAAWELFASETADLVLISDGLQQFCLSDTGAWSRWTGLPVRQWAEAGDKLYFTATPSSGFGQIAGVYTGSSDSGQPILAYAVDAYHAHGTLNRKMARRVRPHLLTPQPYQSRVELSVDYRDPPDPFQAANVAEIYNMWPEVSWPETPWLRPTSERLGPWRSISARGSAFALCLSVAARAPLVFISYELAYEHGNPIA